MSKKGGEGGVMANPKNFIANLRMSYEFSGKNSTVISKKGRGGGWSRPFGSFPKKTSIFAPTVTPKYRNRVTAIPGALACKSHKQDGQLHTGIF